MKITSREMNRIASVIDRVVGDLDVRAADAELRRVVRREAEALAAELVDARTKSAQRLRDSLSRLVQLMDTQEPASGVARPKSLLSWQTLLKALAAVVGGAAFAMPAAAAPTVGNTFTHPSYPGVILTWSDVSGGDSYMAVAPDGTQYAFAVTPSINDGVLLPDGTTSTVVGYYTADNTFTTSVTTDGTFLYDSVTNAIVTSAAYGTFDGLGAPVVAGQVSLSVSTDGGYAPDIPDPTTTSPNQIQDIRKGSKGKNGNNGYFFVPAGKGGAGGNGPAFTTSRTVTSDISVVTNSPTTKGAPAIHIASIGGNGGDGGDSYANLAGGGRAGGAGGSGGNINVTLGHTNDAQIFTNGYATHGVVIQSIAGVGGEGGSQSATTGGSGAGGVAANGGRVIADVNLDITTVGNDSHGVLIQSLGGGAGKSGSSYGLFGYATNGGWGGNGGEISATVGGNIETRGNVSHGVVVQSIGGQGGDGGGAGGIAAFGGDGGIGGNGGSANLTFTGSVLTEGTGSHGLVVQSIGGSGGNGGSAGGLVALGSKGAEGGSGGTVSVETTAGSQVHTKNLLSFGVLAQSIGGGGGNAGVSGGLVAVGGNGQQGGNASMVEATIGGTVVTEGAGSAGVVVQSIGGGGGTGRASAGLVAMGSSGAGGGAAGNVEVTVDQTGGISTTGIAAAGILAQSIGGGGGNAGTTGGLVSLGSKGAGGGNAGDVTVDNDGTILTSGKGSDGILAQAIGGGGGAGGSAYGFVALGSQGAGGGKGGDVEVTNSGSMDIRGERARGIVAQSIGGGGGVGGIGGGVFASGGNGGSGGAAGGARIGGASSTVSDGAGVTVSNSGRIETHGNLGTAIMAQSIGGGGGDGANSVGLTVGLGGTAGAGGAGGDVTVINSGKLITHGHDAMGVYAQSIGGGGGQGGWSAAIGVIAGVALGGAGGNGGDGGKVELEFANELTDDTLIYTQGDRSTGVFAQSIGGGGGNGGFAVAETLGVVGGVSIAIGGQGGEGGDGGLVTGSGFTHIVTEGDFADGMLLQSIGGGGGNGGFSITANQTAGVASVNVGIGGTGGEGGLGGTVTFKNGGGSITTSGDFAKGLVAQSVGGGGGNGGAVISSAVMAGIGGAVSVTIGGDGRKGGAGGVVDINYTGDIETAGLGSTGVVLQSVGGGGGAGGYSIGNTVGAIGVVGVTVGLGGEGDVGGAGGKVTGVHTGNIITDGEQSNAYVAQSIGGGGGSGGFSIATSVSGGIGGAANSIGIGGAGAGGGAGGIVSATVNGNIETKQSQSAGIIAQSVGGGGGSGGYNVSGGISGGLGALSVSVGLGASGGAGGIGGAVEAVANGQIVTRGNQSTAVLAQSVGGGGGSGGFVVSGSIAGGIGAGSAAVGIGGTGGNGGDGGTVDIDATGKIFTYGANSSGLVAQSIGGGGGDGGFSVAKGIGGGVGAGTVSFSMGGTGGQGGDGNTVTLTNAEQIYTEGTFSAGIVAQSVGGGGGNGGFSVSAGGVGGVGAGAVSVGMGGTGGMGGNAGHVETTSDGNIITKGDFSNAYVAQSIGGGGGNGGFNVAGGIAGGVGAGAINVGLGGTGGAGGHGSTVDATSNGLIYTSGDFSFGMIAQSIGGGGGAGGFNVAGGISGGVGAGSISVGLGGNGGSAGDGAKVIAKAAGIQTDGAYSTAFVAQSIGGAGGAGGFSVAGAISGGVGAGAISVGLGGNGAGGGDGGEVDADITGDILTQGNYSEAVVAQSIGGGGGSGGFNVAFDGAGGGVGAGGLAIGLGGSGGSGGDADYVDLDITGNVETRGDYSNAVVAQSLGGGGGAGGFNVSGSLVGAGTGSGALSFGLGGSGGGGGDAGNVDLDITGLVKAGGDESRGVIAQSLGGGGGAGGFNVSASMTIAGTGSGSLNIGLGGAGGDGGDAGDVNVILNGAQLTEGLYAVITKGVGAVGVTAQSIGGGGGAGGFNATGGMSVSGSGAGNAAIGIGGSGGGGGDAGDVLADITGNIQTNGLGSTGVLAQSVGGGGGSGGLNVTEAVSAANSGSGGVSVGLGGAGGDGGDAGDVTVNVEGNISTFEGQSHAVLAQSVGGGGGAGGMNITGSLSASGNASGGAAIGIGGFGGGGGDAGDVGGKIRGDIRTAEDDSAGLIYQSIGGGGGAGGMNVSGVVSLASNSSGALGFGLGGFGGDGGDAGDVNVDFAGTIYTRGDGAYGSLLQSVGGGGGAGGMNVTAVVAGSSQTAGSVAIGLGGFGGAGGQAGDVIGKLDGDVQTDGDSAWGALLQSLGGSGGAGGMNVSGSVALTSGNTGGSLAVGIGGFGGGGGDAGDVRGTVNGDYLTKGDNSAGIIAQSIGGGGGNGGLNVAGALTVSQGTSAAASLGLGGFGGDGGLAGEVVFNREGDTMTKGAYSNGILLQSVGGSGGAGAINVAGALSFTNSATSTAVTLGVGGFGGGGGDAGSVTATIDGSVWAKGVARDYTTGFTTDEGLPYYVRHREGGSNGVVAQSIGGGGGAGGINVSAGISLAPPQSADTRAATFGIGGFGGSGGHANTVDLTVGLFGKDRVQVQANGDNSSAIIAQSIGGGGGTGGLNVSGSVTLDGQLTIGIGGFGGSGGDGDDVTLKSNADVFAAGNYSRGLLVQSIGGGGGAGAINVAGGFSIDTYTKEPTVVFGLGGFGGGGGASGDVTVNHAGNILIEGLNSVGAMIQSIAGGGGSGGLNVSAAANVGEKDAFAISAGIGGSGGAGDDAGDVDYTSLGNIFVGGEFKTIDGELNFVSLADDAIGGGAGIIAQSIGGGGGTGGINATGVFSLKGSIIAMGVGGSGGTGGHGGEVSLTRGYDNSTGTEVAAGGVINTFGNGTTGLIAQSIGGGGGNAGYNFVLGVKPTGSGKEGSEIGAQLVVGGSGAGAGSGDAVDVRHNGTILTHGNNADGLLAQSIGGGGGNASYNIGLGIYRDAAAGVNLTLGGGTGAAGRGDTVDVDHKGDIVTLGHNSRGLVAQSIGGGGGNVGTDLVIGALANSSLSVSIGRKGGSGGEGGAVNVKADGRIYTSGNQADGIVAQSIGGGGGISSAISVSAGTKNEQEESVGGSLSVGIEGGVGATADVVRVTFDGELVTAGDDSRGILAQSIGGGGGVGGAASNTLFFAGTSGNIAVGAAGGQGASSSNVYVDNLGLIQTSGQGSDGILAQSIGGGGGLGGAVRTLGIQVLGSKGGAQNTATMGIGGSGGEGATAAAVLATNAGRILTSGDNAFGIRAQSIGGGGGIGGAAYAVTIQGPADNNALEINVGGSGGTGGAADLVSVTNTGLIYTKGNNASGISANSIGGGGGDAGTVLSLLINATGGSTSNRLVTNVGGMGGEGGTGGNVRVKNLAVDGEEYSGVILTEGNNSHGILAQSLGGGGGNGSSVVNLQVGVVGGNSVVGGLSVGGMGGTGNVAGTVDVENTGTIYTQGAGSHGILAQSIGGGGGNGGLAVTGNLRFDTSTAAPAASLGGFGGDGGNGAKVHVINSGSILTTGANAHGIVAQSIGGGGGNANVGLAAGNGYASAITSTALSFALGNVGGGSGGIGGEVIVDHTGDITVTGEGSVGIKAESINGGGGTLVLDITNLVGLTGMPYVDKVGITHPEEPMIIARLGAESATTMNTGKVTVNTTGTVNAGGERSVLDLAQSIAGGGGTLDLKTVVASHAGVIGAQDTGFNLMLGGVSGLNNAAADIEAEHTGAMLSLGDLSTGILAQAIGGGGGRAVVDFSTASGANIAASQIVLGATDTTGEAGGAIDRQQDGAVVTDGDFSTASLLQSIGGGGGSFVANLTGSNDGVSALLGANGGSGAHGRNIMASYSGGTQTFGDYASGLVLQSIGAGGGELRLGGQSSADITLGGAGGVSGDAGNISLDHNGMIVTSGINAHGMVLQSIGGGGGAAFGDLAGANVDLSSDNSGNAGSVFMRQADAIYVTGNGAYGAIVQSLGGGGGWVDGAFAGSANGAGAGGNINLGFAQGVFALGTNGVGIFAQSQGVDGTGDIGIQADGAVRGGSANGAGIVVDGGATNLITSNVSLSAISGWAMRASGGNDDVVNNGMVAGNIDLGGGDNRFLNSEGASFLAFNTINLREPVGPQSLRSIAPAAVAITPTGDAGTFTNAGLFRVGLEGTDWPIDLDAGEEFGNLDAIAPVADNIYYGARVITTVDVNGDFVQTKAGRTLFDVAAGRFDSDLVNVSGDAVINGSLGINLIWLEDIRPITLFATGGSGTVGDVDLGGTLALNFSLKGDDNGVHLLIDPNFGQPFLRPNEVRLGGHMDSALEVGGATGIGRLMTALGNMVAGQEELYEAIFSELNPEGHVASMQTQYYGATSFANQMFGCNEQTAAADRCIWGKASTSAFDQEATGEYWGATSRIFNARFGIQQRLNAQWAVALSGGYNSLARQQLSNGRMNTQGDGFDLGVGLLRNWTSGTDLRLTATGGWQWMESQRYGYVFKDMAGLSKGENGYLQLGGEVGHLVQAGQFYLRPALNLQATWLHNGSYEETGWDGLGARVVGDDQWIVAAEPKVTTGWSFEPARGVKAGFALTAGRVHRSEDAISLPIQLIGSSNASDPAMISTPLDRSAWRLGFEAKVVTDTGVSFQAGYDGQLGDKADVHTGSVSVRWTF